jgi:hypothetical protein
MAGGDQRQSSSPSGRRRRRRRKAPALELIKPHRQESSVHTSKLLGRHSLKWRIRKTWKKCGFFCFSSRCYLRSRCPFVCLSFSTPMYMGDYVYALSLPLSLSFLSLFRCTRLHCVERSFSFSCLDTVSGLSQLGLTQYQGSR